MDDALIDAYRATRYMVCLDDVEWAELRVEQPLPVMLQTTVGNDCWGFITAWNPHSQACDESHNRIAQRALYCALKALHGSRVFPAIGIGANGWTEPSLFVIGPSQDALDQLAKEHRQNAYVHGHGGSRAQLCLLRY